MFGSSTPKRASRKRISEVWSNVSEQTQPPVLHGETHEQRDADAEAVRADDPVRAARRPGLAVEQFVVQRHGRLAGEPADVRVGPDDVVEEAVVLVEGDQQRGL